MSALVDIKLENGGKLQLYILGAATLSLPEANP